MGNPLVRLSLHHESPRGYSPSRAKFLLPALIAARRRFPSVISLFEIRPLFACRLLSLDLSARILNRSRCRRNSNAATNLFLARMRFASLVLSSWATTVMPLGKCRKTTLVSTFCTF